MHVKIGRNDPCWCGSGKKYKDCHLALDEKINSYKLKGWKIPPKKIIKRPDQIDGIRESGLVNIAVLDYVAENIHAGMSTEDIDRLVAEKTKAGDRVFIPGFGSFKPRLQTSRPARNPRNGDVIQLTPRTIVHFKCASLLLEKMNK